MSKFDALTPESVASIMSGTPEKRASTKDIGFSMVAEKKADAHRPDLDRVVKPFKDRYGIDLSYAKEK